MPKAVDVKWMSAVLESQVVIRGSLTNDVDPSTYLYVYIALQYPAQSGRYCLLEIFYISNWPAMCGRDERPRLECTGSLSVEEFECELARHINRWSSQHQRSREATMLGNSHPDREQHFNLHLARLIMWLQFARNTNLELIMDAMLERAINRLTAVTRGRLSA